MSPATKEDLVVLAQQASVLKAVREHRDITDPVLCQILRPEPVKVVVEPKIVETQQAFDSSSLEVSIECLEASIGRLKTVTLEDHMIVLAAIRALERPTLWQRIKGAFR